MLLQHINKRHPSKSKLVINKNGAFNLKLLYVSFNLTRLLNISFELEPKFLDFQSNAITNLATKAKPPTLNFAVKAYYLIFILQIDKNRHHNQARILHKNLAIHQDYEFLAPNIESKIRLHPYKHLQAQIHDNLLKDHTLQDYP